MNGTQAYILSKGYTDETAIGFGAVIGAPCTVKSIVHENGVNVVTFEWTANDGTKKTSEMSVTDGTPIYAWISGNTYKYGDLVIYDSSFYKCIVENSDLEFNSSKYEAIGSSDGNYDIVQLTEYLPNTFTSNDRKIYFSIEDSCFYLWNGIRWIKLTDSELSSTSTLPIQNKAVYEALEEIKVSDLTGTQINDLLNIIK